MSPVSANTAARELVRTYIENQQMHGTFGDHASTGAAMADMITAMHKKLYDYFLKVGGE